jgi:DNA gyrase subunit A
MSGEQKYKENDEAFMQWEASNKSTLLVFTDQHQCYKAYCYDFADSKASVLGDYLPSALGMDKNEKIVWACLEGEENESIIFFFTNGKAARVSMSAYQTKTKRKKLTNAYSDKDKLVQAYHIKEEKELVITSTDSRTVIFNTALLAPKSSKTSQGVAVISLKKKKEVESVREVDDTQIVNTARYRAKAIPSPGKLLAEEDNGVVQLTLGLEDGQSAE